MKSVDELLDDLALILFDLSVEAKETSRRGLWEINPNWIKAQQLVGYIRQKLKDEQLSKKASIND